MLFRAILLSPLVVKQMRGSTPIRTSLHLSIASTKLLAAKAKPFGHRSRTPLSVETRQRRLCLNQQLLTAKNLVGVLDLDRPSGEQAGSNAHQVVVTRRSPIPKFKAHDREENPRLLERAIVATGGAQHFGAAHLEPNRVDRVMDKAHRVALGVADAKFDFVRCEWRARSHRLRG